MKRLALILLFPCALHALENHAAQSFMFTRPVMHNLAMQQAIWHNHIYNKEGNLLASVQVVPFFQKTICDTDHVNRAATYFLPDCKSSIFIAGDQVVLTSTRDIRAEWLALPANFSGKLSLDPQQQQYGACIEYHQDIRKFLDKKFFKHFWLSIAIPFVVVKNDINIQQSDILNPGTTTPTNILEAFNRASWKFSRINGGFKKSGLAEIRLKIGSALYAKNDFEVNLYQQLSIPTSSKQNATYMFSPYLGNNKHVGVGTGVNFQIPITRRDADAPMLFFLNIEHLYLFSNKQFRTFDLMSKALSRFLLLNSRDSTQVNVPGVNVLTRRVKVKPDSFVDLSTGFRWKGDWFESELGYNLWAHGNERIRLLKTVCKDCKEEVVLEDFGIAGTAAGTSASGSTITTRAANDAAFVNIRDTDLDLTSAGAREAITHRIHGALGVSHRGERIDGFFNLGAFYEHPQNNAALRQWGAWGKIGISF